MYGMPKAIAQTGLVDEVVPLNKIAETITKNVGYLKMDVSQYLEIFIDESNEHLQNLSDGIMILEKNQIIVILLMKYSGQHTLLRVWLELWDIRECRILHMIWKMYSQRSVTEILK